MPSVAGVAVGELDILARPLVFYALPFLRRLPSVQRFLDDVVVFCCGGAVIKKRVGVKHEFISVSIVYYCV